MIYYRHCSKINWSAFKMGNPGVISEQFPRSGGLEDIKGVLANIEEFEKRGKDPSGFYESIAYGILAMGGALRFGYEPEQDLYLPKDIDAFICLDLAANALNSGISSIDVSSAVKEPNAIQHIANFRNAAKQVNTFVVGGEDGRRKFQLGLGILNALGAISVDSYTSQDCSSRDLSMQLKRVLTQFHYEAGGTTWLIDMIQEQVNAIKKQDIWPNPKMVIGSCVVDRMMSAGSWEPSGWFQPLVQLYAREDVSPEGKLFIADTLAEGVAFLWDRMGRRLEKTEFDTDLYSSMAQLLITNAATTQNHRRAENSLRCMALVFTTVGKDRLWDVTRHWISVFEEKVHIEGRNCLIDFRDREWINMYGINPFSVMLEAEDGVELVERVNNMVSEIRGDYLAIPASIAQDIEHRMQRGDKKVFSKGVLTFLERTLQERKHDVEKLVSQLPVSLMQDFDWDVESYPTLSAALIRKGVLPSEPEDILKMEEDLLFPEGKKWLEFVALVKSNGGIAYRLGKPVVMALSRRHVDEPYKNRWRTLALTAMLKSKAELADKEVSQVIKYCDDNSLNVVGAALANEEFGDARDFEGTKTNTLAILLAHKYCGVLNKQISDILAGSNSLDNNQIIEFAKAVLCLVSFGTEPGSALRATVKTLNETGVNEKLRPLWARVMEALPPSK